jgi:hypothetical protein
MGCSGADIIKLRHLVAGSLGLSKQETLRHSKEVLWRLGQAIETRGFLETPTNRRLLEDTLLWWAVQVGGAGKPTAVMLGF